MMARHAICVAVAVASGIAIAGCRSGSASDDGSVEPAPDAGDANTAASAPDSAGAPEAGALDREAGTPHDAAGSPWITHFDNLSPALLSIGSCGAASGSTTRPYQRYWQDDFTKSAKLPDDYFTVATDLTRINQEQEYYGPSQVAVDAKGLHLTAKRVAPFQGKDGLTYAYRSGEVFTNNNSNGADVAYQRYGRWEVCAKLPTAQGSWPAIWLLHNVPNAPPGQVPWPPEIDVMEHVGSLDEIQTNVFWGPSNQPQSAEVRHTGIPAGGVADSVHMYAVEFDANQIDYFVDGTLVRRYAVAANIPSVPMYLVLNLAVGGVLPSYRSPCDTPTAGVRMNCADGVQAYDTGVEMLVTYARMYY